MIGQRIFAFFALLALAVPPTLANAQSTPAPPTPKSVHRQYSDSVQAILETACSDCHAGSTPDAGINLGGDLTIEELLSDRALWKNVTAQVRAGEMPPEDATDLDPEQQEVLLAWADDVLGAVDCSTAIPGRVTIRRLSRREYQNSVRDLTGVAYRADKNFPTDDVGYGFDNIADVLSLSPILMEKYLQAAETISALAIPDSRSQPYRVKIAGDEFRSSTTGQNQYEVDNGFRFMAEQGSVSKTVNLPEPGEYRIRVKASADQAGVDRAEMMITVADTRRKFRVTQEYPEPGGAYQTKFVAESAGPMKISIWFNNDFYLDKRGPLEAQDRNLWVLSADVWSTPDLTPPAPSKLINGNRSGTLSQQREVAKRSINRLAVRAFRRPLTHDQLQDLLAIYDEARSADDSFEAAMQSAVQAVLISPQFLFRTERPLSPGVTRELDDYELATALSYFLWSTTPDDELMSTAYKETLSEPDVLRAQITRMLNSRRSSQLVESFAAQWLQLRALDRLQPDPVLYPRVDAAMRKAMASETKLLINDLIQRDVPITDWLSTDYTFLNERLAEHYGVEGVRGKKFRKVGSELTNRRGLLTQASVLTLTSNPDRTSPVKRGKWVMETLLGEEPPPPDPDAMKLEDQAALTGTMRQRMEQHRANPNCAVCHRVMDELGFALEHYDPVGRWREQDEAGEIDSHGELPGGIKFEGSDQLQEVLQTKLKDKFVRAVAENLLIYAIGRGLEYYDRCAVDKIVADATENDLRFSALIQAICESEPFRRRHQPEDGFE